MKKIELHLHFDGSINTVLAAKLVGRPVEKEMKGSCSATLGEYLTKFDLPLKLLQTEEHLTMFARLLAEELVLDGVIYAEVRFCPLLHLEEGLMPDEVVAAVLKGLHQVQAVRTNLILCMMRHFSLEENMRVVYVAKQFLGQGVVALDLAGDEAARPNTDPEFAKLFNQAQIRGIPLTIHAGEAASHESIDAAIALGARRIGHGVRAAESEETIRQLVAQRIPLEICLSSNIDTGIYSQLDCHPVRQLFNAGVLLTINTDNRTVSDTSLTGEYYLLQEHFGFTDEDLLLCNLNAALASFAPNRTKVRLCQELLEDYVATHRNCPTAP